MDARINKSVCEPTCTHSGIYVPFVYVIIIMTVINQSLSVCLSGGGGLCGGNASFQSVFYFSALSLMTQAGDQRRAGSLLGTVPHIFLEHNDNITDVITRTPHGDHSLVLMKQNIAADVLVKVRDRVWLG